MGQQAGVSRVGNCAVVAVLLYMQGDPGVGTGGYGTGVVVS